MLEQPVTSRSDSPISRTGSPLAAGRRSRPAKLLQLAAVLIALASAPAPVAAAEFFVEMFAGAFLPQSVTVEAGDTVTWVFVAGTHQVTSGVPGGAPGTVDEPGALFQGAVDAQNPTFSYTFPGPAGTIPFHDALSPAQIGFVQVLGDDLTFEVLVLDNVFEPELLNVFEGDSVRWNHEPMEMLHTVTSGLSSDPADNPGALFDEVSSDSAPVFVYLFTTPGDYPYFCIPHEVLGMVGLVRVQSKFIRGDSNRDGAVEIADPISTLGVLFQGAPADSCVDAADTNDDGVVNIADVIFSLGYLFSSGAPPAPPFPTPGPDRTDDGLLCE